jgi:formylglycine-generating enzyme required for sulfatase activity
MEGPMPVGTASQDLSPFGCRDMSGNGLEWTRTIPSRSAERVPLEKPRKNDPVTLRGRSYKDPEPLTFKDLEKKGELEEYQNAGDDIGFRVVLERP